MVAELRRQLPDRVRLVVGGAGARLTWQRRHRVDVLTDLESFQDWLLGRERPTHAA